jgi:predicted nuclease of predicted toxin-antitoxin system
LIRFLANENFPLPSVKLLLASGFDIDAVSLLMPGVEDPIVLERAYTEDRVLLTFDRDYGELIYRLGLPVPAGVVYFRLVPQTPEEPARYVLALLQSNIELVERFTVVERNQVRQRPLPSGV